MALEVEEASKKDGKDIQVLDALKGLALLLAKGLCCQTANTGDASPEPIRVRPAAKGPRAHEGGAGAGVQESTVLRQ